MIHFTYSKGLVMSAIIIIGLLITVYFTMFKFKSIENASLPNYDNDIGVRIKSEINYSFGKIICINVTVDEVGFVYDDFRDEVNHEYRHTYLVVAKVKLERQDKCISILMEGLSEVDIKDAVSGLIKKINNVKDDLRISC